MSRLSPVTYLSFTDPRSIADAEVASRVHTNDMDNPPHRVATPFNDRGLSSMASSGGGSLLQYELEDWVASDLQKFQRTSIDRFLVMCLRKVTDCLTMSDEILLEQSLRNVMNVCDVARPHLQDYGRVSPEANRYEPLIKCCNQALDQLAQVKTPYLKPAPPDDDAVYVCRNDPQLLKANYHGGQTSVKPDIVMTTIRGMRIRYDSSDSDKKQLLNRAWDAPPSNPEFTWHHVLSAWEVKCQTALLSDVPTRSAKDTNLYEVISCFENVRSRTYTSSNIPEKRKADDITGNSSETQARSRVDQATAPTSDRVVRSGTRLISQQSSARRRQADVAKAATAANSPSSTKPDLPPMIQGGTYAINMLCRAPVTSHAITMVIIDEIAWLWYSDHSGAIQTSGLNLFKDLPRFLVLLLAFQRFNLEDWGFIPMFDSRVGAIHRGTELKAVAPIKFSGDVSVQLNPAELEWPLKHYALLSRGTVVVPADSVTSPNVDLLPSHQCSFVVKFSWVDETRVSEDQYVSILRDCCKDDPVVTEHLPWIVAMKDTQFVTRTIRDKLGVEPRQRQLAGNGAQWETVHSSRVLRIIVSEKLYPIADLTEAELVTVFGHILSCHYHAWRKGVCHRDPSISNFMYRLKDEAKLGVPNDWDLAVFDNPERPHATLERTGTVPFMALELLVPNGVSGAIHHLYRHDLEAAFWVLASQCYPESAKSWKTGDSRVCYTVKNQFLENPPPTDSQWQGLTWWARKLKEAHADRDAEKKKYDRKMAEYHSSRNPGKRLPEKPKWLEEKAEATWEWFLNIVEDAVDELRGFEEQSNVLEASVQFLTTARHIADSLHSSSISQIS